MNNSLYAAYFGMRARQQALEVTANNIANAATTAFKGDSLLYRAVETGVAAGSPSENPALPTAASLTSPTQPTAVAATPPGTAPAAETPVTPAQPRQMSSVVMTSGTTDFTPGAIHQTGRSLDVSLGGDGFLAVQTAGGERYTRNGSLSLDSSGQLTTQKGDLIVGERGPITVPKGDLSIAEDGTVSVNGATIDRLKVVRFADPRTALTKEGNALFAPTSTERPVGAPDTRVLQGTLEMSNVNTITEMVSMLKHQREFDSLQKSMSMTMNELGRKVTELGSL